MAYKLIVPLKKAFDGITPSEQDFIPNTPENLGGKGHNLVLMATDMKLPVPPGFIIPTRFSRGADADSKRVLSHSSHIASFVRAVEMQTGRGFGDVKNPLLLSVRSGAPVSMPGMMDTILNVGLNEDTVAGLAKLTNDDFAWDSYRRLIVMYATTVYGFDGKILAEKMAEAREFAKLPGNGTVPASVSKDLVNIYKKLLADGGMVPNDVHVQLRDCIVAVWKSWNSERAIAYREAENIDGNLGTAVTVQAMVFGNLNAESGTGVAFTRDPNSGAPERFGDFLVNAQGEDVVDGSSETLPLSDLSNIFPDVAAELEKAMSKIEDYYNGDLCDIEFTIEDGKLFMLQTRLGKRSTAAQVRITLDRLNAGRIDTAQATKILTAEIDKAKSDSGSVTLDGANLTTLIGTGLGAVPGVVTGRAVFTSDAAVKAAKSGADPVILIRQETSPDDVAGMRAAAGILTGAGGLVSHAAVVARGWNKPCVVGCGKTLVSSRNAIINGKKIAEGDLIKIDGSTGQVFI